MAGPNIHIIGLGVSEFAELSTQTQTVLGGCDMVIGSSRQLDTVASLLDGIDIIKYVKRNICIFKRCPIFSGSTDDQRAISPR